MQKPPVAAARVAGNSAKRLRPNAKSCCKSRRSIVSALTRWASSLVILAKTASNCARRSCTLGVGVVGIRRLLQLDRFFYTLILPRFDRARHPSFQRE